MSIFDEQTKQYEFIKSTPSTVGSVQHFSQATFGAGESSIIQLNSEAAMFGGRSLTDAKAYIKTDGSFKFLNSDGDVLIDSEGTDGNFINVINASLNTASKKILTDFTFESTDYAGAFKTGNPTWSTSTGLPTGGTGFIINSKGIIGVNAGVTTVSILADGTATFAGTLSAPSGTLGTITAGTITGATIQTATTGYRIKLNYSANQLQCLNNDTVLGYFTTSASGNVIISANDDVYFYAGGSERAHVGSGGIYATTINATNFLGHYKGGDGTSGVTGPGIYGFVTSGRLTRSGDKINLDFKYRTFTVEDGIITAVSTESDWLFMEDASVLD